jgi:hypothetical protein
MAHSEHNKPRKSGVFVLIIFGALIFVLAPTMLRDTPELGFVAIVFGFIIGGLGFYLRFVRKER